MSTRWTIQRAVETRPPALHPLAGSNFKTFWKKITGNGPFDSRSRLPRLLAAAAIAARFPFYQYEEFHWGNAIRAQKIERGPIFIVGHWRSGTTHLHNIMSQDPRFGWVSFLQTVMPLEIMTGKELPIARIFIDRVLPENRGYDNVALSIDSPQEEEWALANMNELSFFNSYYFPRSYEHHFRRGVLMEDTTEEEREAFAAAYFRLVKSLHLFHEGKELLFKNPSAAARMPLLKKLFPNARFVHIVRNPYAVFASSLARLPRLMSALSWQKFSDIDFESITFRCYEAVMRRYLEDREKIPPEDLIETSYEKLTENPLREIDRIYAAFAIPRGKASLDKIETYLATLRDYKRNVHQLTRRQVDHIERHWGFAFAEWPYEKPDIEIVG
jgi:hypothetical protein